MKNLKRSIILAIVVFSVYAILALSCATTEYLEKGNISFGKEIDQKTTMDTIVYVLSEHGFGIQMINESFGLTESDWKQTSDIADNIGTTILLGTLTGNNTYYNRYLKLNFRVTETGFTVSPLSNTESQKSNNLMTSSTTSGAKAPTKTSDEGKFTIAIVDEINSMLKVSGSIIWQ